MKCVTGGSGFIGVELSKALLSEGHEVMVIDLERPPLEGIEFVKVNVLSLEALREAAKDCETIYHLAAEVKLESALDDPFKVVKVNVLGTLNVLEVARERDAEVVYASSAAVYGEPKVVPVPEDHPTLPKNVYGASKLGGEALVSSYRSTYGLRAWSLRLFNVYGPSERMSKYSGVVYKFIKNALLNKPLVVYGDGKQVRDFVYISDVVNAFKVSTNVEPNVYNVGTGKGTSVLELAELILKLTGSRSQIVFGPPRPGDIRASVADISKLSSKGWRPEVSLVEGLRRTIEFVKSYLF